MMLTHNNINSIMTMTKIRSKIPIAQNCRLSEIEEKDYLSCIVRKPVFRISDQAQHKPGCTAKEDGYGLDS